MVTTCSPKPIRAASGQIVGHHLMPAKRRWRRAGRHVVQPEPYLAYGVLDLGVAAVVSLQFQE